MISDESPEWLGDRKPAGRPRMVMFFYRQRHHIGPAKNQGVLVSVAWLFVVVVLCAGINLLFMRLGWVFTPSFMEWVKR